MPQIHPKPKQVTVALAALAALPLAVGIALAANLSRKKLTRPK